MNERMIKSWKKSRLLSALTAGAALILVTIFCILRIEVMAYVSLASIAVATTFAVRFFEKTNKAIRMCEEMCNWTNQHI